MRKLILAMSLIGLSLVIGIFEVRAADIEAVLDDAVGASAFSVKDSGSVVGAYIDSDGNTVVKGGMRLDASGAECTTAENLIVDGNVGIGTSVPTAKLHLGVGTSAPSGAPLKFTTGTALGTTEAGTVEFDTGHLWFTITNAGTRYQLDQQVAAGGWSLTGNAGTVDGTNFIGTTDEATAVPVNFRVDGQKAGRIGVTADGSTFLGYQAGNADDLSANNNTFIGYQSGLSNTTGSTNTALGYKAGYTNATGAGNVFLGNMAGAYETGSNAFVVNNVNQSTAANDKAYSLLYGTFSGTAGSLTGQQLVINGNVGIGTSAPSSTYGGLDISSGGLSLVVGADDGATTRTNATNKYWRIGAYHATNVEEPVCILYGAVTATASNVIMGGGSSSMNAATGLLFYTAANSTTITGTEAMRITSTSLVGIGVTAPNSLLHVSGPIATAVAAKTAAYTVTANDSIVTGNATTAAFSLTLPTAASITGRQYIFKKIDVSANAVTIDGNAAETIDGAATYALNAQWKYVSIISDGTNWLVVANN